MIVFFRNELTLSRVPVMPLPDRGPLAVTLMHGKEPTCPATGQGTSDLDVRKSWQTVQKRIEVQPDGLRAPSGK